MGPFSLMAQGPHHSWVFDAGIRHQLKPSVASGGNTTMVHTSQPLPTDTTVESEQRRGAHRVLVCPPVSVAGFEARLFVVTAVGSTLAQP
jgi:hypothetical protein